MAARKSTARKTAAKPRKAPAKKKSTPATATAPASTGSSPDLLAGELPGAVPYRHPDTGERVSRTDYVRIISERQTDATRAAWVEAIAAGKLDRADD